MNYLNETKSYSSSLIFNFDENKWYGVQIYAGKTILLSCCLYQSSIYKKEIIFSDYTVV